MMLLKNYLYVLSAFFIGLLVLGLVILFPNLQLLRAVWGNDTIYFFDALWILVGLLGSLATNFTILTAITAVVTSFLVGINIVLLVYLYRRQKRQLSRAGVAVSSVGAFLGMFGVGCAACGSLIFTALLSSFGGIGLLTVLPLGGQEISILGTLVLLYATYFLIRKITRPITCDI